MEGPPRRRAWQRVGHLLVAVAGATASATAQMSPTGRVGIDAVECAILGAIVAVAATRSPLVLLGIGAAVAALLAPGWDLAGLAATGITAAVLGSRHETWRATTSGLAGAAVVAVLTRLTWPTTLGASAMIAGAWMAAAVVVGLAAITPRIRHRVLGAASLVVIACGLSTAALAWSAVRSRDDIGVGRDRAERALDAVSDSRFDDARAELLAARTSLERVRDRIDSPLAALSAAVPVVSQHHRLGTELSSRVTRLTGELEETLDALDADALRPVRGAFDLSAMERLEGPLEATKETAQALDRSLRRATDDVWIAAPVRRRLVGLTARVTRAARDSTTAVMAARTGRAMLGADGPRRYLVLFMTPAEARGLGGHAGNFAVIDAAGGRLSLARFGRMAELFPAPDQPVRLTGTPEWRRAWGRFGGISGPDGTATRDYWLNITMPPDLPTVGTVASELFRATQGSEIDGVIAMDTFGLGALLRLTGPVQVPSIGRTLDADNALAFLLRDQYRQFSTNDTRVDALDEVARATTAALLDGPASLPDLLGIADTLGPAARGQHLSMWSRVAEEQELLRRLGADNTLAVADDSDDRGADRLAATFTNLGGNKLDAFVTRRIEYHADIARATGNVRASVTVELRNDAPSSGLPAYVYGNVSPTTPGIGSATTMVAIYTTTPPLSASVDGNSVAVQRWQEHGLEVTAVPVVTRPDGGRTVIRLDLAGRRPVTPRYRLMVRGQASGTTPDEYRIVVSSVAAHGGGITSAETRTPLIDDRRAVTGWTRWEVPVG